MRAPAEPVSLSTTSVVVSSVAAAVSASFGPCGHDTLIVSPAGSLLVTNSGRRVLDALLGHSPHPVARLLLREIAALDTAAGDGCTSLCLILAGALGAAARYAESQRHPRQMLLRIARAFGDMRRCWVPCCLAPVLQACTRDFELLHASSPGSLERCARSLVQSAFAGTFEPGAERTLCELLLKWVAIEGSGASVHEGSHCLDILDGLANDLGAGGDRSAFMVVVSPNAPLDASWVLDQGTVMLSRAPLHRIRAGASRHFDWRPRVKGGELIRFVVWMGGSDLNLREADESSVAVCVDSSRGLQDALSWRADRVQSMVQSLSKFGICALFASCALPDPAGAALEASGIFGVQCVPRVEADALCRAAGVSPLYAEAPAAVEAALVRASYRRDGTDAAMNTRGVIGLAAGVRAFRVGGTDGTLVEGIAPVQHGGHRSGRVYCKQLVLRGATDGICRQYRLVLLRGVRLLRCWLGGCGLRRPTVGCVSNVGTVTTSLLPGGGAPEVLLSHVLRRIRTKLRHGTGSALDIERAPELNAAAAHRSALLSRAVNDGVDLAMSAVGKGTIDEASLIAACDALCEGLLEVPRVLSGNATATAAIPTAASAVVRASASAEDAATSALRRRRGHATILRLLPEIEDRLACGEMWNGLALGADGSGVGGCDSVEHKLRVLVQTLAMLEQLLRIDSIVPVSAPLTNK